MHELPRREQSREGFVESLDSSLARDPDTEKLSEETITTVQGLVADRLDYSSNGGQTRSTIFIHVDEAEAAVFVLLIFAPMEEEDYIEPLIELFIDSFRVWDTEERDDSAASHLDRAWQLTTNEEYEEALEAFGRSIELDPELTEAYRGRAGLLFNLGRYEEALIDVDKMLEWDPEDTDLIAFRASILWYTGRLEDALSEMDRAIEMDSGNFGLYNNRALMLSQNGEYERALADVDKTIELLNGELPPGLQDTRGYVYLKMGELDKALADFEEVLDSDYLIPQALLGAGIIHGRMGNNEKAVELINKAMEQLEEYELALEAPDPQLADPLEMAAAFSGEEADSQ